MTHPVRWLTEKIAIAGQISPEHMQSLAEMGFKSIICNRPDNEYGPGQPSAESIRDQAEAAGLRFAFLPVSGDGGTARDAQEMGKLLATGGNPAANASYADSAFVANRFRVVQRRYHV